MCGQCRGGLECSIVVLANRVGRLDVEPAADGVGEHKLGTGGHVQNPGVQLAMEYRGCGPELSWITDRASLCPRLCIGLIANSTREDGLVTASLAVPMLTNTLA